MLRRIIVLVTIAMFAVAATACEKEGPAEKAGKQLDKTTEDVGKKLDEFTKTLKEPGKN